MLVESEIQLLQPHPPHNSQGTSISTAWADSIIDGTTINPPRLLAQAGNGKGKQYWEDLRVNTLDVLHDIGYSKFDWDKCTSDESEACTRVTPYGGRFRPEDVEAIAKLQDQLQRVKNIANSKEKYAEYFSPNPPGRNYNNEVYGLLERFVETLDDHQKAVYGLISKAQADPNKERSHQVVTKLRQMLLRPVLFYPTERALRPYSYPASLCVQLAPVLKEIRAKTHELRQLEDDLRTQR